MSTPNALDRSADLLPVGMGTGVVILSWVLGLATHHLDFSAAGVLELHAVSPSIWLVDLFPVYLVWARRQQVAQWLQAKELRRLQKGLEREADTARSAAIAQRAGAADILGAVQEGLFRVDSNGNIVDGNEPAATLFGIKRESMAGITIQTFLPHLDLGDSSVQHTRRTSRDDLIAPEWHTTAFHSSGQRFPAVITVSPIPMNGTMGSLYAIRDVGPQRSAMAEMQREMERRLGSTAGSMADTASVAHMNHSLRTPLAAILGYAEMLGERTRDDDLPELTADVSRIEYAGRELLNVLDNLTDLSLELAGKLDLTAETARLATLVDHAVQTTRPLAEQRNNQVEVASNLNRLTVLADPQRTRRVLVNVLARAHSATQNGHIRVTALRTTVEGQPFVAIEVSDDGNPMTPEEVVRHLDQSTGEGARLGLWLCRRLARRMGGDLDIQRVKNATTLVTVSLPTPINPTLIPGNATHWSPPSGPQEVKYRGLLVGLSKDGHVAASHALPEKRWAVETCREPEKAPAILRDMKPDLLLVGEQDAMGTWRLLDQIRRDPVLAQSPVILVSAHPDPRRAWRARLPVCPPEAGVLTALCTRILERGEAPRVVVAEADLSTAADLAIALRLDGCSVTITHDTDDALDLAVTRVPDLLVLGPNPGRGPGLSQVLAAIRAEPATRDVPLMVSPGALLSADVSARLQQFRHAILQPSELRNGDRVRLLAANAMRPRHES